MPVQYESIKTHFDLLERITREKDPEIKKELCRQDIALYFAFCRDTIRFADDSAKESMEAGHLIGETYPLDHYKKRVAYLYKIPRYPSFKTLAVIHEKEKDYDKAIMVCKAAIDAGCIEDGTKGGMTERLRKLEEKRDGL